MANITNLYPKDFYPSISTVRNIPNTNKTLVYPPIIKFKGQPEKDTVDLTAKQESETPKINTAKAIFKYLDQETINQVNETGKLPENMMVTQNQYGKYVLAWRDPLTQGQVIGGTQKMPEHLELKRDILGFTHVVPKDYDHFLIK